MELSEEELLSLENLKRISGPISLYYYQFDNRNFYFFGDEHFSTDFNCEWLIPGSQCSKINNDLELDYTSDECWDIDAFLKIVFDRALQRALQQKSPLRYLDENNYIDLFLEIGFMESTVEILDIYKSDGYKNRNNDEGEDGDDKGEEGDEGEEDDEGEDGDDDEREDGDDEREDGDEGEEGDDDKEEKDANIVENYEDLDYMNRVYNYFILCFEPSKRICKYAPFIRFHYADIRQLHYNDIPIFDFFTRLTTISADLLKILNESLLKPSQDKYDLIRKYTNILTLCLHGNVFTNMYVAYLDSPNFPRTIRQTFRKSMIDYLWENGVNLEANLVERHGVNIHRIKAQLDSLREDGVKHNDKNIADLISSYAIDRYPIIKVNEIRRIWLKDLKSFIFSIINGGPLDNHELIDLLIDTIDEINSVLLDIGVSLMDTYLLARMFRRFSRSEQLHIISKNVIIYTGSDHTDFYAKFFEEVLNVKAILKSPQREVKEDEKDERTQRCVYNPYVYEPGYYDPNVGFYIQDPEKGHYVQDPNLGDYFPDL